MNRAPRSAPSFIVLLASALALSLGACQRGLPEAVPVPIAVEPAAVSDSDTFAVSGAESDAFEGRPAAVLRFTQPLASAQNFDQLLTITRADGAAVDGSWALDADGQTLRFPYLEANQQYRVRIDPALSAAAGATLGAALERNIDTGPLPPLIGFASQGNVLPTFESRGLPIIAVNQSEVDLEFLRVRDADLGRFLGEFSGNQRLYSWNLERLAGFADSVYANRFALNVEPNQRTVAYVSLKEIPELAEPGMYFAIMKRPATFETPFDTAMFFVSDIGLHVRAYAQETLVYTASLESGDAQARVDLSLRDGDGKELASAQTDANGLARFASRARPGDVLTARRGKDASFLAFNQPALDLSEFSVGGREQREVEVFPWSGRDLYRPGETLKVSALLRDGDGRPLPPQPLYASVLQPDGRAVVTLTLEPGELGYYELIRAIPLDAATGRWQVRFATTPDDKTSPHVFAYRVEEFLPERLKLDFDSPSAILTPGQPLAITVAADYLYGAPAAASRFTAKLAMANALHPVDALKDWFFGDGLQTLPSAPVDALDQRLDADGKLSADLPLALPDPLTGPVQIAVQGSVFETGGRAVSRNLTRVVWPAPALVAVRPLFAYDEGAAADSRARFELIKVNASGARMPQAGLKAKLVRELRDYHWTYDEGSGWRADFVSRFEDAGSATVDLVGEASAEIGFDVEWGDYRLEVLDPATGLSVRLPFFAGWRGDDERSLDARPDKIKIALNQTSYRAGDTVVATLTPPHDGPALILLESDRLLWETRIEARAGSEISIPIDPTWNRHDLYLTAMVFRPGSSRDRITPKRAVGVAHVPLDRAERELPATLTAQPKVRPGEMLDVLLSVPQLAGQTARVRLTAVDLGVLNITRWPLPDAAKWFFGRRALGVEARDIYGRIIESYDGVQARLRFGGDMALPRLPGSRRANAVVETVDLTLPPVAIGADGNARIKLPMPDFNGTLRVRALVYGDDRYAAAEVDTVVQAPLVAEASLPRALTGGDRSSLVLDLTNLSGARGTFNVTFAASGPVAIETTRLAQEIEVGERRTVRVPIRARDGFGVGVIEAKISGPGVDLTRRFQVSVRPAWPALSRASTREVGSGERFAPSAELRAGLIEGTINQRVSLSTQAPLPLAGSAQSLLDYPYGCIEQTISKAWPLLLLDPDMQARLGLNDLTVPDQNRARLALTPERRAAMLDDALTRISAMQTDDGHFAMWPGESQPATGLTPYVAEFLLAARDAGVSVPESVLNKTLDRLHEDLLSGGNADYRFEHYEHLRLAEMAWAGYVLAKIKRAPTGTLRALMDNERGNFLTPLPLVQLGAALALMGDQPRADAAFNEARTRRFERPQSLGDYGSALRDEALMLAVAADAGKPFADTAARAVALARSISSRGALYLSTQEQVAIVRLGSALAAAAPRDFALKVDTGGAVEELIGLARFSRMIDAATIAVGLRLTPSGAERLYLIEEVSGVPLRFEPAENPKLRIRRDFFRADGKAWDRTPLTEGELLIARLRIDSQEFVNDALVVDLSAGGLEVENLNLTDPQVWDNVSIDGLAVGDRNARAQPRHEEFRDDRYVAALDLASGETTLLYLVRAVSPGSFTLPRAMIEDMYRPELRAYSDGTPESVVVVEAQ